MSDVKQFMCDGCGDWFPYTRRRPKYCDECRRIKLNASIQRYKKRRRKMEHREKGDREEKFTGKSDFVEQVGGAQYAEIARVLGIDFREVHKLERQALMKIRDNPELKEIWGSLKEELASGAVLSEGGLMGAANKGNLLLDYQQAVADWWHTHDEIAEQGCTDEALECLAEITLFQQKIAQSLLTI